jgi:predicted lipid carrier protein YhbT
MKSFTESLRPQEVLSKINQTLQPVAKRASETLKPVEKLALGGSVALGLVPRAMQANALEPMLNHALQELIDNGEFDFLEGHCCAISVRDRALAWHLCFDGTKLLVRPERSPDVTISATVPAFLNLISKRADPDALFFQRQLSIEGDVELGLYVKNLLDALDEDDLPLLWKKGLNALRQMIAFESQD